MSSVTWTHTHTHVNIPEGSCGSDAWTWCCGRVWTTWSLHRLSCSRISVETILSVSSCSLGKELSYRGRGGGGVRQEVVLTDTHTHTHFYTWLMHSYTVATSSWLTMSTNWTHGPLSLDICFFTMASNAMSGVNRPVLKGRKTEERKWKEVGCARTEDDEGRTLRSTWRRGCFWWRSWSPVADSAHPTPAEDKHRNEYVGF